MGELLQLELRMVSRSSDTWLTGGSTLFKDPSPLLILSRLHRDIHLDPEMLLYSVSSRPVFTLINLIFFLLSLFSNPVQSFYYYF